MRLATACLLLSVCVSAEEARPLPEGASLDILVQEVRGEVDLQPAPNMKWIPAQPGQRLAPGAKVCTGVGGEAVVLFGTNSVAIVSETSMFEVRAFGMKGDELVAEAFIDPGVAHVSVKQLQQFQTDFQVSTPRMTCSVRGSAYTIWSNGGAGLLDAMRCNEHLAEVILANLQQWVVNSGLVKDSGNDTPDDTQTRNATTDVTPEGSTPAEQVARLVLLIAHTLAQDPGSLTRGTSGSPANGETREALQEFVQQRCSPEDIQRNLAILRDAGHDTVATFLESGDTELRDIAQSKLDDINEGRSEDPALEQAHRAYLDLRLCLAAAQLLEDRPGITTRAEGALLFTTIDNLDVLEHLARDPETEGQGGIDGEVKEGMFLFARRNGFDRFTNEAFLPYLDNRFRQDPEGLGQSDPQLFAQRRADFLDDGSGFSFNDFDEILALADTQAHSPVTEDAMARLLMTSVHVHFHIFEYALPPGTGDGEYGAEHQGFHDEFLATLNGFRQQGDIDRFLATYVQGLMEAWEDRTDCSGSAGPQDPCFEPLRHYEDRLLDVVHGFRGATGRFEGYTTQQELDAIHVYAGFSDLRHHLEPEDVTEFQESHDRRLFELAVFEQVGLAASVDVFDARQHHEDFHDNLLFLQQQDPQEAARRHDQFHDMDNFGFDTFVPDWQAVQDQARLGLVSPDSLGHALLDSIHKQAHLQMGGLPSGNQPGQYDFEHDGLHQDVLDPLHATLEQDFPQFTHDLLDGLHQRWHDETGVPLAPGQNDPGLAAHEHLHESLDQLHDDMHSASGTTDGQ